MTYSLHSATFSPVGLWQLVDGDLTDTSGNGLDLSLLIGTSRLTHPLPRGPQAFLFNSTVFSRPSYDASLAITGDMTIELLTVPGDFGAGATRYFVSFSTSGATLATNTLYGFGWISPTGQSDGRLIYTSESGAGVATTYQDTGCLRTGVPAHVAMRRSGDVITFFINGKQAGSASSVLTTPAGGTSSVFCIGGLYTASYMEGSVWSVKVHNTALSDANILSDYNDCFGDEWPREVPP